MTIKILLLGNTGQLGWELNRTLFTLGELTALDYPQINMADPENIRPCEKDATEYCGQCYCLYECRSSRN